MKLRDLERHLAAHSARKVAEGAKHTKWRSADGTRAMRKRGLHLGRVEAHHGHRVGLHGDSVLNHAVERLAPSVFVELDIRPDLAADESLEERGDVSTEAARSNGQAEHLSDRLHDPGKSMSEIVAYGTAQVIEWVSTPPAP